MVAARGLPIPCWKPSRWHVPMSASARDRLNCQPSRSCAVWTRVTVGSHGHEHKGLLGRSQDDLHTIDQRVCTAEQGPNPLFTPTEAPPLLTLHIAWVCHPAHAHSPMHPGGWLGTPPVTRGAAARPPDGIALALSTRIKMIVGTGSFRVVAAVVSAAPRGGSAQWPAPYWWQGWLTDKSEACPATLRSSVYTLFGTTGFQGG